jgi:hypothetical protein
MTRGLVESLQFTTAPLPSVPRSRNIRAGRGPLVHTPSRRAGALE